MTPAQTAQAVSDFQRAFETWSGRQIKLTDSAAWYRETFPTYGNWDSWIWETVCGVDFRTRRKNFDGFVVLCNPLGRANAGIVRLAIRNGLPVLAWKDDQIHAVTELYEIDANNWIGGWQVQTEAIGA